MKRRQRRFGRSVSAMTCALLCTLLSTGMAAGGDEIPQASGIWHSREPGRRLAVEHEEVLVQSLRRITGWRELRFSDAGSLEAGDASPEPEGSAVARQILERALSAGSVFIIEDHSDSPMVNFGQLDQGTKYEDVLANVRLNVWRVRMDFGDFRRMQASPDIRDTFDPGFIVLHELLHGFGYEDPKEISQIGDCEELINQVREDLGLMVRDRYFGEPLRLTPQLVVLRLRFRRRSEPVEGVGRNDGRDDFLFFVLPAGYETGEEERTRKTRK